MHAVVDLYNLEDRVKLLSYKQAGLDPSIVTGTGELVVSEANSSYEVEGVLRRVSSSFLPSATSGVAMKANVVSSERKESSASESKSYRGDKRSSSGSSIVGTCVTFIPDDRDR